METVQVLLSTFSEACEVIFAKVRELLVAFSEASAVTLAGAT